MFVLHWITILPNILYAIVIIVGEACYRQLAAFLNDLGACFNVFVRLLKRVSSMVVFVVLNVRSRISQCFQ